MVCEVNCDTPSGEAEAVALGLVASEAHPEYDDPASHLEDRLCG